MHKCEQTTLGINIQADFALVFAMLHEVPDKSRMLGEIFACLKPNGQMLLAEPPIHVSGKTFDKEVTLAQNAGFKIAEYPHVRWSRAVLFAKDKQI
jgi:hypothetical protein